MPSDRIARLDRGPYALDFEDRFDAPEIDTGRWVPRYLPQWTTAERAATRYDVGGGLVLRIDADQPAWSPEYTADLRVSSLQTGVFSGPAGGRTGQHRFRDDLTVRQPQSTFAGYTPQYGLFELAARFADDPTTMAALWMIGFEDVPERSAELCVVEIFGRDVGPDGVGIGMGIRRFHDPRLRDEFAVERIAIDARDPHWYAAEWTPERVIFYVDEHLVKVVPQSPAYPMQLMLSLFEFREPGVAAISTSAYPKRFVIETVRASRRR
jgi:hypothetical protein